MASETETLALHLVHALDDASNGRPMQWRKIEQVDGATADGVAQGKMSSQQLRCVHGFKLASSSVGANAPYLA
jgi:hypothetical protein